jgi:AcrR family transcriptional regulator
MARTRAATYDDQQALILARAAELFARRGYSAATMNDVAAACAVSKATLYHYVRDKPALLARIALAHVERLETVVAEVRARRLVPEAELRALIEAFMAVYAGAQHEHRVLTEDVKFLEAAERERVLGIERRVVDAFADTVAAVRPALKPAELHKPLTMLLFGMINWMFTWLKPAEDAQKLTHEQMAPMVAELFFGGLGAVSLPATPAPDFPARKKTPRKETAL